MDKCSYNVIATEDARAASRTKRDGMASARDLYLDRFYMHDLNREKGLDAYTHTESSRAGRHGGD